MLGTPMRRWGSVAVVLLLATGCSGDDAEPDDTEQTTAADSADDGADTNDDGADDGADADDAAATDDGAEFPDDLCTLVQDLDLEGAFSGQLTFDEQESSGSPILCELPVEGAAGDLHVGLVGTGVYDLEVAESGEDVEQVDLGREAILQDDGDLWVLVDDETAFSVWIIVGASDDPPPSDQVLRDGVVEVARGVLGQL